MNLKNLIKDIEFLIYPPRCCVCGCKVFGKEVICSKCKSEFQRNTLMRCFHDPCFEEKFWCITPFYYRGTAKKAIIKFKFYGKIELAEFLSLEMSKAIKQSKINLHFDYITSVPLSKKRLKRRGYNQSELLAKSCANHLNLPYVSCLVKQKDNKEQHTLKKSERKDNVKGVYRVIENMDLVGKRILLIDDIATTGFTLSECAKTLVLAGAKKVVCSTAVIVEL